MADVAPLQQTQGPPVPGVGGIFYLPRSVRVAVDAFPSGVVGGKMKVHAAGRSADSTRVEASESR